MEIIQKTFTLNHKQRGFHLITNEIYQHLPEIKNFKTAILNLIILHTSAAITINENADPSVRFDLETFFNKIIPENPSLYQHISEGLDDMPSHIKASIFGNTLTIPINNGKLNLGTWQGIYLCEFRNSPHTRKITATIIGEKNE